MDSITHIALGACMGEAFAGKKLGHKALIWGAVAQSFPDIDFITSFWMDTSSNLLAHRGFTHSFLFCALLIPIMALLAEKWHKPHNIYFKKWLFFFFAAVGLHVIIDAFNNYGVGWFEPFSHARISFNTIYVADPFFSLPPILGVIAILFIKHHTILRKRILQISLLLPACYLILSLSIKYVIDRDLKKYLQNQNIHYSKYFSTPAPLQNLLWFVVAGDDKGFHVGFLSLLDQQKKINFHYFPKNDSLLKSVSDHENLQKLKRFSKGFYTVAKYNDTLVFNDLRFGQIIGWENPGEQFAFHFYLEHPKDNKLVVQRGRFAKWNTTVAKNFLKRIIGN